MRKPTWITRRNFVKSSLLFGASATVGSSLLLPNDSIAQKSEPSTTPFLCPPFLGRPTDTSITMNLVGGEQPVFFFIKYGGKNSRENEWRQTETFAIKPYAAKEIDLKGLSPETGYRYQIHTRMGSEKTFTATSAASFSTRRGSKTPFSFALFSDSHINPFERSRYTVLNQVTTAILQRKPDIALMLGDNIQTFTSHGGPMTEERFGPVLYTYLRHAIGNLPSSVPLFSALGNWEGENGWHPEYQREWAREARLSFIPSPMSDTYPEGGSASGDYYGFNWGDALFLVLNVTGYTTIDHSMGSPIGKPNDWTLGEHQKQWLYETLSSSKAKFKFIFIHHTIGGNAGDDMNSRYGRGGGRAAFVGEQATIHKWLKDFNVQALFYGHDHVFTDIPVDGIHYVCVGSAGAPWKFDTKETGYDNYWTPSGYTWVDVEAEKVTVSFIAAGNQIPEEKTLHRFEIKL